MSDNTEYLTNLLAGHISKTDLQVSDAQITQLIGFVRLIQKWNKAYNLTSVRDPESMLLKHIMDSIVVAPYLDQSYSFYEASCL